MARPWVLALVCLGLCLPGCGQGGVLPTPVGAVVLAPQPGPAARAALPAPGSPHPDPASVRAVYVTPWTAGSPAGLRGVLGYLRANGLNAVVIDVKGSSGHISFALPGTRAQALGADDGAIPHPRALLATLHAAGIYVIGRVVAFADPLLARAEPDLALPGRFWGEAWVDPRRPAVQAYDIQIGAAAARLGFDEIQFDDVLLPGSHRGASIDGFLRAAARRIRGVPVAADVLGIDALSAGPADQGVGQSFTRIAHIVPVISPLLYPGRFAAGAPAYATVWQSLAAAEARTADLPAARIRPWIRAGSPAEVGAELRALAAAGVRSFMLWSPSGRYRGGVDFGLLRRSPLAVPARAWLPAAYALIPSGVPVWLPARVPAAATAYSVTATADAAGYAAVLWATGQPLPANDPRVIAGQPLLEVSGARRPGGLAPLPALIPPGQGIRLRWQAHGMALQVWAPDRALARAAMDSMQQAHLMEGR